MHPNVHCPPKLPREAGLVFTCTAKLTVGSYPVSVNETNGSGHLRYENRAPLVILNSKKVEAAIRQSILRQRYLSATVGCPTEVLQEAGITFTCLATIRAKSYPFTVTEVDGNGRVRYLGRR